MQIQKKKKGKILANEVNSFYCWSDFSFFFFLFLPPLPFMSLYCFLTIHKMPAMPATDAVGCPFRISAASTEPMTPVFGTSPGMQSNMCHNLLNSSNARQAGEPKTCLMHVQLNLKQLGFFEFCHTRDPVNFKDSSSLNMNVSEKALVKLLIVHSWNQSYKH